MDKFIINHEIIKRKRGRPSKNKLDPLENKQLPPEQNLLDSPPGEIKKRGRGRPRKGETVIRQPRKPRKNNRKKSSVEMIPVYTHEKLYHHAILIKKNINGVDYYINEDQTTINMIYVKNENHTIKSIGTSFNNKYLIENKIYNFNI
jgi:hypothetical protein